MYNIADMKLTKRVFEYELPVKIIPEKGSGFLVSSPEWSDCYAQGDTIDEAILEVTAVAQALIELYKEENKKIPLRIKSKNTSSAALTVPVLVAS